MIRYLSVRHSVSLGVAAVGIEAVLSAIGSGDPARRRLVERFEPAVLPSAAHVLAVLVGLALLVLAPRLWRGTRAAVALAIVALGLLAVLDIVKGLAYAHAAVAVGLAVALACGRRAFSLGSRNRPRPAIVLAATGSWVLAWCAVLAGPLFSARGQTIRRALHDAIGHVLHASVGPARPAGAWILVAELLIGCAVASSLLALRSLLRPAVEVSGHSDHEYRVARAAVERHGLDSLSPFVLRPDAARTTRLKRIVLRVLGRRFQMDRLVRFNEKFFPEWRPRYLVYESRAGLARTALRVLQAEGHLPQRQPLLPREVLPVRGALRASRRADVAA